ncbi:MAG: hypothetical protein ACI8VE_000861 [Natrialbaceae archaeon]|jgi:hypothetical protein
MADLHSGVDAIRDLGLDGVFTWFFDWLESFRS